MKRGTYLKTCGMILVFSLWIVSITVARTIYVDDVGPADFNTIQAAINDANDGDTIIVADGTYTGTGNRDIDFLGKAITMRSENGPKKCIIDCNGTQAELHRGLYFHNGEGPDSVLDGFTITNGYAGYGGGICCENSSCPTIESNIIRDNCANRGAGIACVGSSPTIINNLIKENEAFLLDWAIPGVGGGISCRSSSPVIAHNAITGNRATGSGGGVSAYQSSPILHNNVITGNYAFGYVSIFPSPGRGAGISCERSSLVITNNTISRNSAYGIPQYSAEGGAIQCGNSRLTLVNSILWDDTPDEIHGGPTIEVRYSDVQGGWPGLGNIDDDPCFADTSSMDPNEWDCHLRSQAGRWDPNTQTWVQDEVTSPCVDAGNPEDPIGNEPFPNGGVINMGAYGGTTEASKSYFGEPVCETVVAGDINGDCEVNFLDFRLMAAHWLQDENQ